MKMGVDAAGAAGGFVEGAICYTGDVADPSKTKYDLEYFVNYANELAALGVHSIAIKDMAGLLTPQAAELLVGAIRKELPDMYGTRLEHSARLSPAFSPHRPASPRHR